MTSLLVSVDCLSNMHRPDSSRAAPWCQNEATLASCGYLDRSLPTHLHEYMSLKRSLKRLIKRLIKNGTKAAYYGRRRCVHPESAFPLAPLNGAVFG